ncbi:Golgi-associated plant pathogenesis-related protein 1-like [Bradysia coprophila]|uniref:Golgi-associated plant pathogenesis-related protein 1-like n=1 Tax=Bradysia coprophila TaxID=38358 RepID=UPI00187D8C90|nr:Golgi-associated plant pathogenesis-related protein 1-like [Bradysia coprophila]
MRHILIITVVICAVSNFAFADFRSDALNLHNKYRAEHHAPPLKLKDELNKYAQKHAQKMSSGKNKFKHSYGKYGENIYMDPNTKITDSQAAIDATNKWYDEKSQYSYRSARFGLKTGHFTQVIWTDTKYLGVGVARSEYGVFVCANYDPRGNVASQFLKNVLAP